MGTPRTTGPGIGEVAARTGLTERSLRYYEELGLVRPERDGAGRRRYGPASIDRLYRVRVQREMGTALADVDPEADDLASLVSRHVADLDARIATLGRRRERARAAEDRLASGHVPSAEELLGLLVGSSPDEPEVVRRVSLLVYRDVAAAHAWLTSVFGLTAGPVHRAGDGHAHLAVLRVGDGEVWLHEEHAAAGLSSPLGTDGRSTASLAVLVDDVDAHHAMVAEAGAMIEYAPTDQPYGYREYGARDPEGHLWSFQHPLEEDR